MAKLGRIELVHNFTGETDYVIIQWVKTSAPLTEVGRQEYPAPHSQETLLIEDLDPVMFLVRAYRSADGIALDEQINELAVDAGARATYSSTTYEYIVDRGSSGVDPDWEDPTSGTVELRDERLLDGTYQVHMRGLGIRGSDEITDRSDLGGGFDLAVSGETFNSEDRIFVTLQNRVDATADTGSGSGSGEVDDVVLITADDDFDVATMNGKLLFADAAGSGIITLSFASLALIADCTFKVSTHGGNQRYLTLQLDAGDTVEFMREEKNAIHLGKAEEISIIIRNNVMYILGYSGDYRRVGSRSWGDKLELNTLYRDGTEYDQADYPRLMEFIDSLPALNVLSYGSWATDKGKFARDDIAGTFKVPDDREMFIRAIAVDGSIIPGRNQTDSVGPYTDTAGSSMGSVDTIDTYSAGVFKFKTRTLNSSGETRPDNIGMLPLIYI